MGIVQKIHQEVDAATDVLLKDLEGQAMYLEEGFKKKEHYALIREYKQLYPSCAILSEAQIKEICLKYDLVFGNEFSFTGEIPEKNKTEIESFQLAKKHNQFKTIVEGQKFRKFITSRLDRVLSQSDYLLGGGMYGDGREEIIFGCVSAGGFRGGKHVFPIAGGVYLVYEKHKRASQYISTFCGVIRKEVAWSLLIENEETSGFPVVIDLPQGLVRGELFNQQMQININTTTLALRTQTFVCEIDLSRLTSYLASDSNYGTAKSINPYIIAPASMFNTDSCVLIDDWKLKLDDFSWSPAGASGVDPIWLIPVKGAYIAISKWGEEAEIEETQSPNAN